MEFNREYQTFSSSPFNNCCRCRLPNNHWLWHDTFSYATLMSSCPLTLSPYLTFRWSDKYLCALHKIYANNFTAGRMWNCMYPRHINLYNRKRSLLCIDAQIRFVEREKHENQIRFFENFPDFFFQPLFNSFVRMHRFLSAQWQCYHNH